MHVRRGRADEWPTLKEFRLRALADAPDAFGSTLDRESADPDAQWQRLARQGADGTDFLVAVAAEADVWAGMAWGHLPEDEPGAARLYAMWVDPERRGRGHGRALVEHVAAWARERGATELQLRVAAGNTAAAALYGAAGFRETGVREPLRDGSAILTITMVRPLD